MGFRLYIQSPFINNELNEICFGKLYGYIEKDFHCFSLDYLLSLDFFDEEDLEDYGEDPYLAAINYFDSLTYGSYEIEYKNFCRFISLYISDRAQYISNKSDNYTYKIEEYLDDFKCLKDLFGLSDNEKITLTWC